MPLRSKQQAQPQINEQLSCLKSRHQPNGLSMMHNLHRELVQGCAGTQLPKVVSDLAFAASCNAASSMLHNTQFTD